MGAKMVDKIKSAGLIQVYKMILMAVITLLLAVTTFTLDRLVTKLDTTAQVTSHNLILITELKKDSYNHESRISQLESCTEKTRQQVYRINQKIGL